MLQHSRRFLAASVVGASMALCTLAAGSASAAGPGWVSHGSDGAACITRDAYLSSSGTWITVAQRLRCRLPVNARLNLKDSTTGQIVRTSDWVSWDNLGGYYYAKVYWERTYAGCVSGHRYQVVVSYTVAHNEWLPWYSNYFTTGTPAVLC